MLHRSVFIAGGQVCCSYLGASYPQHTFKNSVQLFLILQKVCQTVCNDSDVKDVEKKDVVKTVKKSLNCGYHFGQSS